MFEQTLVGGEGGVRRTLAVVTSSLLQVLMVLSMVAVPMIFTSELPGVVLAGILSAPGLPPPPPGPRPQTVQATPTQALRPFTQPAAIPTEIITIVEDAPPQAIATGPYVPYSIGSSDGVPDGVIGSFPIGIPTAPPPAPKPEPKPAAKPEKPPVIQRVRAGGEVKAPVPIHRVSPRYSPLAIQTRTSGTVTLQCVIAVDGRVTNIKLVSGPALPVKDAIEAVREWRYRPTLLNGEPVEVEMRVDVQFRLNRRS